MLEKPDLQDEKIISSLQDDYGLMIVELSFLPLGADKDTAVYRAISKDGFPYFVKLRSGVFDEVTVTLPKYLKDQGMLHVIAPLTTVSGHLWADLDDFKLVLYPFIDGHNGYDVDLSHRHWKDLGRALKSLHTLKVPDEFMNHIPQEAYSSRWRGMLETFLARLDMDPTADTVVRELIAFLKDRRDEILDLVERADGLAVRLQTRSLAFVLCHSDIHAGNVLIDPSGTLYIVDWDNPIFAPKERDLMFIGGGHWGEGHSGQEEEALFYQGYGPTEIDQEALAYYRYERIVEDIAVFCDRIFLGSESLKDREQSLHYLKSNFLPNSTIQMAYQSDKTHKTGWSD